MGLRRAEGRTELTDAIWIAEAAALTSLVEHLGEVALYAFDTEFHRERTYYPHVALVQVQWDDEPVVLVDPLAVDLAPLAALLEGPGVVGKLVQLTWMNRHIFLKCLAGDVTWGRLSLRNGGDEETPRRSGMTPSRATPITLAIREDLPWLLQATRGGRTPQEPGPGRTAPRENRARPCPKTD